MSAPSRVSKRSVFLPAAATASLAAAALFGLLAEESRPVRQPVARMQPVVASSAAPSPARHAPLALSGLGAEPPPWRDGFSQLGSAWASFVCGTPGQTRAAIEGGHLALDLDTRGADPTRVHGVGVVRRAPALAGQGLLARVVLEWGAPGNASGKSAGLVLTRRDPFRGGSASDLSLDLATQESTLAFEVVGVPPGDKARLQVVARAGALRTPLSLDAWPTCKGRAIERIELELEWSAEGVAARADGRELARSSEPALRASEPVWLLVHASSQAGCGPRPVRVEEVALAPLGRRG